LVLCDLKIIEIALFLTNLFKEAIRDMTFLKHGVHIYRC